MSKERSAWGGAGRSAKGLLGRARRFRLRALVIGGVLIAVLGGFLAVFVLDRTQQAASVAPEGVESFEDLDRAHVEGTVPYEQTPPVGGEHNPVWQNCGFYDSPVRSENAVHSVEHGAVWITYRPDLPAEQVETLRQLTSDRSYVLVSPFPDLPASVVASAWGKQLELDGADDPRLEQFVNTFKQGPQTPEPGAPCAGRVGEPQ